MSWFPVYEPLLPDVIAQHGKWQGERTALIEGERRLSWREFERDTARIANGLADLGLRSQDRVAVLMDNSLEMALLLFGILRSGCVAVPLNVSISDAAVAAMIEDSGARAVFASGHHCARVDGLRPRLEPVSRMTCVGLGAAGADWLNFDDFVAAQTTQMLDRHIEPAHVCNIIYSSGTTGVPKGIVHTHRCRMNWAFDLAVVLRYQSDCVTLCSLGLFSNITWVAMLATILVGGTMVVMSAFDAAGALALIKREQVTHGTFVPVQLERLLEVPALDRRGVDTLDTIMCCGSPLPLAVKEAVPHAFKCDLIELYGLTEGVCTILAPEDFARKTASVGKPFLGTELCIIGDDDREVPLGAIGEVIGLSRLMMAGYHGRDDASADATWTDSLGRRWLRTGDLGRLDEDGFLYIVDRKKDMILSGGQNIYPADIEAVIREHPDVDEVAVVAATSRKWGETPVAVVVLKSGCQLPKELLIDWTNTRVGKQQRIRDVIWRASLPRNANGKLLKRELRRELAALVY
jgi:acyl-CoA synthetase (AMP-forming)/AMP-acid ligase II